MSWMSDKFLTENFYRNLPPPKDIRFFLVRADLAYVLILKWKFSPACGGRRLLFDPCVYTNFRPPAYVLGWRESIVFFLLARKSKPALRTCAHQKHFARFARN